MSQDQIETAIRLLQEAKASAMMEANKTSLTEHATQGTLVEVIRDFEGIDARIRILDELKAS